MIAPLTGLAASTAAAVPAAAQAAGLSSGVCDVPGSVLIAACQLPVPGVDAVTGGMAGAWSTGWAMRRCAA